MKSKITFILALAAMVVLAIAMVQAQNDWPMFNRDLLNTGVADQALTGITDPIEIWNFTTDNQIGSGSPVIGDIDGDSVSEILIPTCNFAGEGGVLALNSDGTLKWKYETGDYGTYATPPLADIDGDGKLETIFPSYGGKIVAVDDGGTQMWVIDTASYGTLSVIADIITYDVGLEVVAGVSSKTFLLKASDGTQIWEAPYGMRSDPAIADLDGDGKPEIVFAAWANVVALNGEDGSLLWTAGSGQFQGTCSILGDINGDGKPEVAVGNRYPKALYVFSGSDGTELWNYAVVGRCFSAAVADFNGDGYDDVVTTATKADGVESYVYLLDVKNKTLLWQHNIVGKKYYSTERSPSIADVNGDGTPDVLIAGLSQNLYALSGIDGSEIWTIATNDPSAGVPAVGDLDGDGGMEIVVSAGSSVQVFTQEPPPPVEMAYFDVEKAKIDFKKKPDDDKIHVKGRFKLAPESDGVDISEWVIITIGKFSDKIIMEEKGKKGDKWEYKRDKGGSGDIKHMKIDWKEKKKKDNQVEFDIHVDKAALGEMSDWDNPVTISIQIGNDIGEDEILMRVKKHHWDYHKKKH